MTGLHVFETALGWCGLAWTERGVRAVRLPEREPAKVRDGLQRRFPEAAEGEPPELVVRARDGIVALMAGERLDLLDVAVDLDGVGAFERAVYAATRDIPPGRTRSYGEVAAAVGEPGAAQAVGRALGRNPLPVVVPCHRVLAADGRLHGFSGPGGLETKLKLLAVEGALGGEEPTLFGAETLSLRPR